MKIAVVNPNLEDSIGGGEAVSLSILSIITENHDVDYFTKNEGELEKIGQKFGYDIPSNAAIKPLKQSFLSKLISCVGSFVLLRKILNDRKIRKTIVNKKYDKIIFTAEVFDSGKIEDAKFQYVHSAPPNREEYSGLMRVYLNLCKFFSDLSLLDTSRTIFNSKNLQSLWGSKGKVIYPPIAGGEKNHEKRNRAVAVGRISPDKNFKEAIEVAEEADIDLTIAGLKQDEGYLQELRMLSKNKDFVEIKTDLPREELNQLISESKIGLLCRRNEPLGMVVVEYMKAGVLPMVRNEGGPKEIVPGSEFTYDSVEEASEKIQSNLKNFEKLQEKVEERSKDFSEKRFRKEIQKELEKIL